MRAEAAASHRTATVMERTWRPVRPLALAVLCGAVVWGQSSQERGKRVVMEAVEALGGERFLTVRDRTETGRAYSFYRDQVAGLSRATIYTQFLPAVPDGASVALRERQSFLHNGKELSAVLFTGGQGYEITFRGARPLPLNTIERYNVSTLHNVFYILRARLNEPGMMFQPRGTDVWMNHPVEIVDIVDAANDVVTVYFHQSSKFPVRQVYLRRDPRTRERFEEVTEYGKFREGEGGVWWPLTLLRTRDGQKIFEMFSETVAVNQGLSESLFTLPAGIKILKRL